MRQLEMVIRPRILCQLASNPTIVTREPQWFECTIRSSLLLLQEDGLRLDRLCARSARALGLKQGRNTFLERCSN